ncbi:hypothetical protein HPB52_006286 [Rhipicephalus sanguineus]|uniref:Uncharacterized protein n=1 Tax=Rhipicephalus sanguineus TaxID=34632 RepID=A0A9D4QGT4_RHISA|nr:hypothetical protein HPB52_006286 [Rhipicephalus sanguineus]
MEEAEALRLIQVSVVSRITYVIPSALINAVVYKNNTAIRKAHKQTPENTIGGVGNWETHPLTPGTLCPAPPPPPKTASVPRVIWGNIVLPLPRNKHPMDHSHRTEA